MQGGRQVGDGDTPIGSEDVDGGPGGQTDRWPTAPLPRDPGAAMDTSHSALGTHALDCWQTKEEST